MTDERIERDVHDHDQDEDTSGILTEEELEAINGGGSTPKTNDGVNYYS